MVQNWIHSKDLSIYDYGILHVYANHKFGDQAYKHKETGNFKTINLKLIV